MPVLSLADNFTRQLEQSASGTINNTEGPGVALYWASDTNARADIYVGLILDGLTLYQNISSIYPNITMQFALPPDVSCESDDLDFDPNKDKLISIQVSSISRGSDKFSCNCAY